MPSFQPLLESIKAGLEHSFRGKTSFRVTIYATQPRRSYALFAHAVETHQVKIYQEDILISVSEQTAEGAYVPVSGIELMVYTIPSTATSIVYVSKVDTSGLQTSAVTPTKQAVVATLRFFLEHPVHGTERVRIHVFARAQGQYLFPGSVDNTATKRVLDDKALIKWWTWTLNEAATADTSRFYFVPGASELDAIAALGRPPPSWTYGHSYDTLPSVLHSTLKDPTTGELYPIVDLIPAFPDDPKARFLMSLASSKVSAAGAEDDYDELMSSLRKDKLASESAAAQIAADIERGRNKERARILLNVKDGGLDGWWERMAFRQECSSGAMAGFFVLDKQSGTDKPSDAVGESHSEQSKHPAPAPKQEALSDSIKTENGKSAPEPSNEASTLQESTDAKATLANKYHKIEPYIGSFPHNFYIKLWSRFHNMDYAKSNVSKVASLSTTLNEDVANIVASDGYNPIEDEKSSISDISITFSVDNPVQRPAPKQESEPAKVVNKIVPRKRVKKETPIEEPEPPKMVNIMVPRKKVTKEASQQEAEQPSAVNVMVPRKKVKEGDTSKI